jgi:rfaE bifunctional protein nucleotidyltransferase chain/domain
MSNKIITVEDFIELKKALLANKQIVFTNGCFDILHPGHTDYLSKAKKLGDLLVVGVNTDASVQILKGKQRPIQNLDSRVAVLAALSAVDYVIPFDEETPLLMIKSIQPNILVKGGDYTEEAIVGAKEVKENNGKVVIIPFLEGHSTSKIVDKIKQDF